MRRFSDSQDDGAVLVLVLAFLAFFGVVVVALLGQADVSIKNTGAVNQFGAKVYAADAGLDVGLEAVQTDATVCPEASSGTTTITDSLVVDTKLSPVTVTCRTTDAGVAGGWRGYGIIITSGDPGGSFRTQSGPDKEVEGAVFINGGTDNSPADLKKKLKVTGANVIQAGTPCASPSDVPVAPTPPYRFICDDTRTLPALDAVAPAVPSTINPAVDVTTKPGCSIFSPGRYTTAPALSDDRNYFKSGVYYFDNLGGWQINKKSVVGGQPKGASLLDGPCVTEPAGATGVIWVLTGNTRLTVSNNARVELHSWNPAVLDGTPRISLFVQGSRPDGTAALDQLNGNPQVVFHGTVYSPQADVGTNATGGVSFYMLNGVVARRLLLQSTSDGLRIGTENGETDRLILVEAVAKHPSGGREVKASAVVQVYLDGSIDVRSRRSQ